MAKDDNKSTNNSDRHLCKTCRYRGIENGKVTNGCDYIEMEKHSRGCSVEECDKYVKGRRKKAVISPFRESFYE